MVMEVLLGEDLPACGVVAVLELVELGLLVSF